jgi:hypothetical protein
MGRMEDSRLPKTAIQYLSWGKKKSWETRKQVVRSLVAFRTGARGLNLVSPGEENAELPITLQY